jgi:cob(I)alamin adenosyltransferase
MTFLRYAYVTPVLVSLYPLYGSMVRGIGKGWTVHIRTTTPERYVPVKELLQDPSQLLINAHDTKECDLILCDDISLLPKNPHAHLMVIDPHPRIDSYDLISAFERTTLTSRGVTAITGDGKGKTTSALGMGVESLYRGESVTIIQWFKEKKQGDLTWAINEHQFPSLLKNSDSFQFFPMGLGFFGSPQMDRVKGEEAYQQHRRKAYEGLELAKQFIRNTTYDTVILDELVDTVTEIAQNIEYPLIDLPDMRSFLEEVVSQSHTKVVVTGRRVTKEWEDFIHSSILIKEVKHPWSTKRQGAISGLDF